MFTFPLLSKTLATTLGLSQPQLTTVVLAGVAGQYPFSALVGYVVDRYGPAICSLSAAALFSSAFALAAREVHLAGLGVASTGGPAFHRMILYFGMAGLATVLGLFSALFSAARLFPEYVGAASGTSMALFGLSPLFFTIIAGRLYTDVGTPGLDVAGYLTCVSLVTGGVHLLGAFILPGHESTQPTPMVVEQETETTPLLRPVTPTAAEEASPKAADGSLVALFKDTKFWLLAFTVMLTLGVSEMILSNMGSIVLSLPRTTDSPSTLSDASDTATQVKLLSVSNTVARLLSGTLADVLSPMSSPGSGRRLVSRTVFIAFPAALLAVVFLSMEFFIHSRQTLWVLSIGVGLSYGTTFAVLPGILRAVWGKANEGRNFGILSYAPMIGTPIFSYLYAFLSRARSSTPESPTCYGEECWESTVWVCFGTSVVALVVSANLWVKWRGLL